MVKLKKKYSFLIGLMLICIAGKAQFHEIGFQGGVAYYTGDLNRTHFKNLKPAGGVFYRHNFNPRISAKAFANFLQIEANDVNSSIDFNKNRNLNFQSNILELGATIEVNFFEFHPFLRKYPWSTYLFAGINYFNFNPKTEFNGNLIELQPLGTEGQETTISTQDKYSLNELAIPFGIGIKANLSQRVVVGLEFGLRRTKTDYLDDVSTVYSDPTTLLAENGRIAKELSDRSSTPNIAYSQRGDQAAEDWYSFTSFNISFRLGDLNACFEFKDK